MVIEFWSQLTTWWIKRLSRCALHVSSALGERNVIDPPSAAARGRTPGTNRSPSILKIYSVSAHVTTRNFLNREGIYVQGDKADAMFYVTKGHVKLTVVSKSGKKAVIAILRFGNFFGEGCLTRQALRMSTATSIQPSTIARVKRGILVRLILIRQDPAFAKFFIANLLFRITRIEESFVDQIFSSSEQQLARIL
jgi:CRP-like cAMP-binding protein